MIYLAICAVIIIIIVTLLLFAKLKITSRHIPELEAVFAVKDMLRSPGKTESAINVKVVF